MATEKEIIKALARLMDCFTIYNKDPEAIKAFTRIVVEKLDQFPAFIIDRAVEKIIETFTFMPKIAEMMAACYGVRDEAMRTIINKQQDFKADWYANKIHAVGEWETLRDEFLKLNSPTSAAYVMADFEHYGKPYVPVSPEKIAEAKKKLAGLSEQFGSH